MSLGEISVKKYPVQLGSSPVVESVLEVRYSSKIPSEAIFGIIYTNVDDQFDDHKTLPILEFPETMRTQSPNLKYQPHYELRKGDNLKLRIGPQVLLFSNSRPYLGWPDWFGFVKNIFSKIRGTKILSTTERLGIRYINLFPENILDDKANLQLIVNDADIKDEPTSFRIEMSDPPFRRVLQVANSVSITVDNQQVRGSVIDIDYVTEFEPNMDFYETFEGFSNDAHNRIKRLFFDLLKPAFLKTLDPSYEG